MFLKWLCKNDKFACALKCEVCKFLKYTQIELFLAIVGKTAAEILLEDYETAVFEDDLSLYR